MVYDKLKNKFNNIYLLTLSSRTDRRDSMLNMLSNIGMKNNEINIHYATPFPYNDIIIDAFNKTKKGRFTKPNEYDCSRNHYAIIKEAYDLGYKYCLIVEDDLRFLNNEKLFEEYIDNIPDDFDIIQFGGFTTDPNVKKYLGTDKGFWVKHRDVGLWTTSMYALSRKGMSYYLAFMDKIFWVADGPTYKAPLNDKLINTYMSTIPLVIQADKTQVSSDIRDEHNDTIDYNNDNLYESEIDINTYFTYKNK